MVATEKYLEHCLYFTANSLARSITRLAEECFKSVGLSPSHAFLMMLAIETPGISPSELAGHLHLAPSTVTRLADSLIHKGLLEKSARGKAVSIRATEEGEKIGAEIAAAWKALYHAYSARLGEKEGQDITRRIHLAAILLDES